MNGYKHGLLAIALLLIGQFILTFEMYVVLPLAPYIASLYEIPYYQVTYMNIGHAFLGLFAPILGYNADRWGLKKMILLSMISFLVGSGIIAFNSSLIGYFIGRSLTGLSFFAMLGIGISYLSLLVKQNRLGVVSGLHRFAFGIGVFISPLLGTYLLESFDFFMIYRILALTTMLLIGLLYLVIPDITHSTQKGSLSDVFVLVKGSNERKMMAATFLIALPAIFFFNYLSVHLHQLGFTSLSIANIYTSIAAGSVFAGIGIMIFSDKVGKRTMLVTVATCAPIALVAFYFSKGTLLFILGFTFGFLFDSAVGLLFPVASLLVTKYKATFLTVLSLILSLVNVISSFLGPTIYAIGGFGFVLAIAASGIALASFLLRSATKLLTPRI